MCSGWASYKGFWRWQGGSLVCAWLVFCAAAPKKEQPPSTASSTSRPSSFSVASPSGLIPSWKAHLLRAFSLRGASGARRFDASGLGLDPLGRGLLTVNDKPQKLALYLLPFSLLSAEAYSRLERLPPASLGVEERVLPLQKLYQGKKSLRGKVDPVWKERHYLDLEGVTSCQGHTLMVSEQQRVLFRLHPKTGAWTRHPISTKSYEILSARQYRPMPRFSRSPNAGYEGIACDEKRQRIYLIQERQPRLVLHAILPKVWMSGQSIEIVDHFDVPSKELPRYQEKKEIPTDFSGGHVDQGALYLISRNEYAILKVDPQKKRLLGRLRYHHLERRLFQTREPYGLAEGLVVHGHRVWLIFDNNGRHRLGRRGDRAPVLLELQRPLGF